MTTQRTALVTGANRGLGLEICRQLAKAGVKVLLTARTTDKAQDAARTLADEGLEVAATALDMTDDAQIDSAVAECLRRFGRIDILVNNAGVLLDGGGLQGDGDSGLLACDRDTLRATFETNVYGPLRLIQAVLPQMQRRGYGRIVNVSSGMGQLCDMGGGWPAYRLSKAALNALTRITEAEAGNPDIKVNAVSPGWVRTDMGGANASSSVSEGADTIVWAALLDEAGPSGCFLEHRQTIPW